MCAPVEALRLHQKVVLRAFRRYMCVYACTRASVHVVTSEVPGCCRGGLRAADCECVTHPGRILSRPAVQIRPGDKRRRREGRREGEMSAEEREMRKTGRRKRERVLRNSSRKVDF